MPACAPRRRTPALYVDWGRWVLADATTRSIAPGFTITPTQAEELTAKNAAEILAAQLRRITGGTPVPLRARTGAPPLEC